MLFLSVATLSTVLKDEAFSDEEIESDIEANERTEQVTPDAFPSWSEDSVGNSIGDEGDVNAVNNDNARDVQQISNNAF